ncbi:hypothetical protein F2Q69_00021096 [Brassica cretica]|uniref:Rhodanese domain-containing protein n=1 Tax=Brassica cretica TaxID=69181 RepID=A0A8S9QI90_BRACR|nr:hypothetical protein F2Q69_00021096 [Brassica cretica]
MALHYFISDSHREDFDFVHWERIEEYHAHGDNVDGDTSHGDGDDDEDESPDDSSDEVVMIMLMVDILLMNQQVIELWKVGGEIGCLLCEGLHRLGETEVPVYDGSWTEWATEPDLPMEGEGDESSS